MSVIGVDIDGILANFNSGWKALLLEVSGEDRIGDTQPQTWNWDLAAGYTQEVVSECWRHAREDKAFWFKLQPLPGAVEFLASLDTSDHEVYFITDRPGFMPQVQTQLWLQDQGYSCPSVIISRRGKGIVAQALGLDYYIDDKAENWLDVEAKSPDTENFLLRYPYNVSITDRDAGGFVVDTLGEFWEVLDGSRG